MRLVQAGRWVVSLLAAGCRVEELRSYARHCDVVHTILCLYSEYLQLFLQPCDHIHGHIVVTHVKSRENICRCDYFLYDEDKDTRHTYHDIRFLPLGRRSAITIVHDMALHIVSFRQSCRSSSLAVIAESVIEKEARMMCLQHKFIIAYQCNHILG